jgi:hypothetical protein
MLALAKAGLDDSIGSVALKNSALGSGGMAAGQEDQLPPRSVSDRCGFGIPTFAGASGNGQDAPIPAVGTGHWGRSVRGNVVDLAAPMCADFSSQKTRPLVQVGFAGLRAHPHLHHP